MEKFSVVLGFLLGVIAFLSGLIMTMTWFHFLVPLGLLSSFLLMLSYKILVATTIVAPVVLKNGLPRMSGI
jgi:multisubunit Na+/H+ antiporter MnhE subunit